MALGISLLIGSRLIKIPEITLFSASSLAMTASEIYNPDHLSGRSPFSLRRQSPSRQIIISASGDESNIMKHLILQRGHRQCFCLQECQSFSIPSFIPVIILVTGTPFNTFSAPSAISARQ
jgi:hypothetical protein